MDATDQAALVAKGEITPRDLLEAAIERIEQSKSLNAVVIEWFDHARSVAVDPDLPDGPFRGVPFLLKDLYTSFAGQTLSYGNVALKEAGKIDVADTTLVARFKAAGLVIAGRTNTPEMGSLPTTQPLAWGPTLNPWALERTPGGSSGGARRPDRDPPLARLESQEPAARRRDADAPAPVRGVGERDHPDGHRGGGATTGPTRRTLQRPRVARRPPGQRLCGRQAAHLRGVRPPGDDQPGRLEPGDQHGVGGGDLARRLQRPVAARQGLSGEAREQVLEQKRDAAERAVGRAWIGGGYRSGMVEPLDDHCV